MSGGYLWAGHDWIHHQSHLEQEVVEEGGVGLEELQGEEL